MDIRITPFTTLRTQPKISLVENRNRFDDFNKLLATSSKQHFISITPKQRLNNTLVLSSKTIVSQPVVTADKKGVLLYQQVERNKLFSNGSELINRLHFKV